jgi:hypothetical protein
VNFLLEGLNKMNKIIFLLFALMVAGCNYSSQSGYTGSDSSDINKIIAAKQIVRGMVNYPDTLDFHNYSYSPTVSGNTVTLKFTAKNAFGVPETHVMDIQVN